VSRHQRLKRNKRSPVRFEKRRKARRFRVARRALQALRDGLLHE